jgi:trimethylamine--corrinoid protein Co-methyltransferase
MRILTDDEGERILQAALRVWARVPLRVQGTPEFLDALAAFGCRIDGEHVSFGDAVRERVLARIEAARPPAPVDEPVPPARLDYSASGQALWCHDPYTNDLRAATERDLADFSRVCDALGLARSHPTFIPQDVPLAAADFHAFATIILNSARPGYVSVYSEAMLPYFIDAQAVVDGSLDRVREQPRFFAKLWVNTPFMMTGENIRVAMRARELLGWPLSISTMPVAGIATPATLAGALVLATAEVLACNAVSLALDDRLIGWCANPLTFDMKTAIHVQTGPDCQLLRLGAAQMGAHVFGGSYVAPGGPGTSAKLPGEQAMMEKALDTMWAILGGARSFGSLACLAYGDIGSTVQLLLDLELMRHFERLLEGIKVDDDRLAEDVICEVAPLGARFLDHPHTAAHYRGDLFISELMDRRVPGAWLADPRTMLDSARSGALRLLETAPNQCPLNDEQLAEIKRLVAAADREAGDLRRHR